VLSPAVYPRPVPPSITAATAAVSAAVRRVLVDRRRDTVLADILHEHHCLHVLAKAVQGGDW